MSRVSSGTLLSFGLVGVGFLLGGIVLAEDVAPPAMSEEAQEVEHEPELFRPDPIYTDKPYLMDEQLEIYGGKRAVPTPRPFVEEGRDIYESGPFDESSNVLGELNPAFNQFAIYGDWKVASAFNNNGDDEVGVTAVQLNLDFDYKFTATERAHVFIQPLNQGANFTRCEFAGPDSIDDCEEVINGNIRAAYVEGDVGAIYAGLSDEYNSLDLPFALGLIPFLVQNGVWLEDFFTGFAVTLPALNSPRLDISNMDFTVFAGFDQVSSDGVLLSDGNVAQHNVNVYGFNTFIERRGGYWEAGYAYTDGEGKLSDQSYNNVTFAYSTRLRDWSSNSIRVIWNFGQHRDGDARQNADGFVVLLENSLITSRPLTLVPYLNLFAGFDRPQSLARDGAAGGVLENTGINFETDNLTGFPKLDDTANNTFGGAIGVSYLFGLDQQLVLEFATVQVMKSANVRVAKGDEYAVGLRYQLPLNEAWIIRADLMGAVRENDSDLAGGRLELRRKF